VAALRAMANAYGFWEAPSEMFTGRQRQISEEMRDILQPGDSLCCPDLENPSPTAAALTSAGSLRGIHLNLLAPSSLSSKADFVPRTFETSLEIQSKVRSMEITCAPKESDGNHPAFGCVGSFDRGETIWTEITISSDDEPLQIAKDAGSCAISIY